MENDEIIMLAAIGIGALFLSGAMNAAPNFTPSAPPQPSPSPTPDGSYMTQPQNMSASAVSENGIAFIKAREGFLATIGNDVGHPVIGYGHDAQPGETLPQSISMSDADALLRSDLIGVEQTINSVVTVPLSQNQYDALASFVYNVGSGAFTNSTLLADLNNGNYAGAAAQFAAWNKAGGSVNSGLVNRRVAETNLFTGTG